MKETEEKGWVDCNKSGVPCAFNMIFTQEFDLMPLLLFVASFISVSPYVDKGARCVRNESLVRFKEEVDYTGSCGVNNMVFTLEDFQCQRRVFIVI